MRKHDRRQRELTLTAGIKDLARLASNRDVAYPPANTLKRITDGVWIVDGPAIRFGPPLLKFSFPTRMTVLRLASKDLFIHSPTPLVASLRAEIEALGEPRWIVGPNRIHYWWISDWHAAYPGASVYLAPGIEKQSRGRIDLQFKPLDRRSGYQWDDEIATLPITSSYMTEAPGGIRTPDLQIRIPISECPACTSQC